MKFTVYNLDLNYADFLLVIGNKHTDNPNIEIYIKRGQETEFKEFEPRLKHDWFHLKLCSVVSRFEPALDRNRFLCSSATRFKFFKFGLRSHKVKSMA